mmetsp:Transcript_33159/g.50101  ORF Transcript_33159/g.50101 Transcript_33159/m.50101 type:complete len:103 (-) Transcript_33159:345-653(-)
MYFHTEPPLWKGSARCSGGHEDLEGRRGVLEIHKGKLDFSHEDGVAHFYPGHIEAMEVDGTKLTMKLKVAEGDPPNNVTLRFNNEEDLKSFQEGIQDQIDRL